MLKKAMERNLKLLYVIRIVRSFGVFAPVIVLFYQENGLSQTEVFALQSIFALAVLLLEVPSGYFADVFGRRLSVILGGVLAAIGFGGYSFAMSFPVFVLFEVVLGLGLSFLSGADQALARDSLIALGKEHEHRRFEAKSHEYGSWASALAAIAGGLIALISLRSTIIAQAIIEALLIPAAILLVEPPRTKPTATQNPWQEVRRIVRYSLREHQQIKWLIAYSAVVTVMTHTMFWLNQPLFTEMGVPLGWFGLLTAGLFISQGFSARASDWYERRLGKKRALTSFVLIGTVCYLLVGSFLHVAILPILLGFQFIRGAAMPVMRDYINEHVESSIRATVLSVSNLVRQLLYTVIGPVIGFIVDQYSLGIGLYFSAAFYGALGLFVLTRMNVNGDL